MNIIVSILCLLFVVVAKADILEEDSQVKSDNGPTTTNGIDSSFLDSVLKGHSDGQPIMGRFVYTGDDGQQYDVSYFADVYGYQAQGRLILPTHPLASFIKHFDMEMNTRITLKGKYGSVEE